MYNLSSKSVMIIVISVTIMLIWVTCNILKGVNKLENSINDRYSEIERVLDSK